MSTKFITLWRAVDRSDQSSASNGWLYNNFYAFFASPTGAPSLILGGWAGSNQERKVTPTNIIILERDSIGIWREKTSNYVSDKKTYGVGDILVADFNSDGKDDLVLPSNNEGSLVPYPGIALISSGSIFQRLELPVAAVVHDATLSMSNDRPIVLTGTLTAPNNPVFTFDGQKFIGNSANHGVQGNSGAVIPAATENEFLIVKGDVGGSFSVDPLTNNYSWDRLDIEVYRGNGLTYSDWRPIQKISPYLATLDQYNQFESAYGKGIAHTYQLFVDDLNHDGYLDIIAANSMWVQGGKGVFPSSLQLLINSGRDQFTDRTAVLYPKQNLMLNEGDYSLAKLNTDQSGIDTLVFSGGHQFSQQYSIDRWPFSVLLNDGTGRIYVGLDSSSQKVKNLLNDIKQKALQGLDSNTFSLQLTSDFFPMVSLYGFAGSNSAIDFLAQVVLNEKLQPNSGIVYGLYSTSLTYKPSIEFTESVRIEDRNSSSNLRSWAGNDTFFDRNPQIDPSEKRPTKINGGLGIDTSVYTGAQMNYAFSKASDGSYTLSTINKDIVQVFDVLSGIERLKFSDISVAIDTSGNAGQGYRIYKAAFNRDPMNGDKGGLGYWIAQIDKGMDLIEVSARFVDSNEFRTLYGTNPTNDQFLTKLYTNVLGRQPEASGYNWWLNELNTNPEKTKAKVLADFAESAENQTGVVSLIGNGITYEPWVG